MEKVVLGLSGGVDSAVAANLLQARGLEVIGLYLDMGFAGKADAQKVADTLGISLHIADNRENLAHKVCSYFGAEYQQARTPNPCVVCNRVLKFKALIDLADQLGAKYIATGHYARVTHDAQGRALLQCAQSPKDQTYMLANLPREVIARCIFPLGEAVDKDEVRALAQARGLSVADKKDSMDVCFIPDGNHADWLARHNYALPKGNFVDENGKVLGQHNGLHCYTVGQRKGLGIASTGRLFVHALRPETNEVVLSLEDVYRQTITVSKVNLCAPEYVVDGKFRCQARVRYSKASTDTLVTLLPNDCAQLAFASPVRAPSAGQFAVFYDGDLVIGGGFID